MRVFGNRVREHPEDPTSLEDIAQTVNRGASHLARQVRGSVGVPPHQYLLVLHIKRAQQLLLSTNDSIAEIAFACGFSHQEHLTRMFRRWCDTAPGSVRKAARN